MCVQVSEQVDAYLQVFVQARSVAEIGFNGGHSMLMMLTANPGMEVQSFDVGVHDYSKPALEVLKGMFASTGARIDVQWGNSTETVPAFQSKHPNKKYDVVIVDGAHTTDMCVQDTLNMRVMAKPGSMLIIDDTPCKAGYCVDECVEALTKAGVIKLLRAHATPLGDRAFSLFRFVNGATASSSAVVLSSLSAPSSSGSGEVKAGGSGGTKAPRHSADVPDHHHGGAAIQAPAAGSANAALRARYEQNLGKHEGGLAAKGFGTSEGHSGQVRAHTHKHTHIVTHTHTHSLTHTHMYTHTHTQMRMDTCTITHIMPHTLYESSCVLCV